MTMPQPKYPSDPEVDWIIARAVKGAAERTKHLWEDYSPTTDPREAYDLILKYKIDTRYFDPVHNPELEAPWLGGLQYIDRTGVERYYTAFGPTPLIAAMKALVKCLEDNKE